MKPFARISLSSAALRRGSGKCENIQYPVSNIQYPLFNDGGANWILDIGCWLLDIGYLHIQHRFLFPVPCFNIKPAEGIPRNFADFANFA